MCWHKYLYMQATVDESNSGVAKLEKMTIDMIINLSYHNNNNDNNNNNNLQFL